MIKKAPIILYLLAFLQGCGSDLRWTGFVYPDSPDLSKAEFVGNFESLEACRDAAKSYIQMLPNANRSADYECGLNCRPFSQDLNICDKTSK
jgi:hypothetical protein